MVEIYHTHYHFDFYSKVVVGINSAQQEANALWNYEMIEKFTPIRSK